MTEYHKLEYWEDRYKRRDADEIFDWLRDFSDIKTIIIKLLQDCGVTPDKSILHIGCGNSDVPGGLYENGYHRIVNIDFSETVIANMAALTKNMTEMTWVTMDVLDMKLADGSFDCVLDKGTLDAITYAGRDKVHQLCREVVRVLRPGGVYLCLSFGHPDEYLHWFLAENERRPCPPHAVDPHDVRVAKEAAGTAITEPLAPPDPLPWTVTVERVRKSYAYEGDANFHFLYIVRKRE